ncbi:hypothetical protein, partial [Enterococcus faecium]
TVGDGVISAQAQAQFDAWHRAVPRPLDAKSVFQIAGGTIRIAIPYPAGAAVAKDAYFYPITPGMIDYARPQSVVRDGDRLVVETKAAAGAG